MDKAAECEGLLQSFQDFIAGMEWTHAREIATYPLPSENPADLKEVQ